MSWIYKQAYPNASRSKRVRVFVNQELYFCLAKHTPWGNPDTPPDIPLDILSLPEPIVYIRPIYVLPALRSPCGNKVMCGPQGEAENWQVFYNGLFDDLGHNVMPTHAYVALEVRDEYFQTPSFRCTALLSDLKVKGNLPMAITYPPSLIEGPGLIQWVSFHSPVEKVPDRKARVIEFMLEP
jgi:hypothetical protein